ncbi:hypothetical protein FRB96_003861 [Tulasnella sp. 330]|nr:hypothetical protein FRB96_003861 [Tulasnella sp. 330]
MNLPPAKLGQSWNGMFDHGVFFAVPTSFVTAPALLATTYQSHRNNHEAVLPPPLTVLSLTKGTQLALPSVDVVGTFGFGMIFIDKHQMAEREAQGDRASEDERTIVYSYTYPYSITSKEVASSFHDRTRTASFGVNTTAHIPTLIEFLDPNIFGSTRTVAVSLVVIYKPFP